jgi:heat shock protein HslJ
MLMLVALAASSLDGHAQTLADQNFEAVRLYGKSITYEQSPSLAFGPDGQVRGLGGCNTYGARYSTRLETRRERAASRSKRAAKVRTFRVWSIRIRNIVSTRKYCGPASVVESRFFNALRSARRYVLKDGSLTLYGARGRAPLAVLTRVAM